MDEKQYVVCWFDSDSGTNMWSEFSKDDLINHEFDEDANPIIFDINSKVHWLKVTV